MNMMNRRNAMLGWATWNIVKRVMKKNAAQDAAAAAEESKRRLRLRRQQVVEVVEPKRKRRSKSRVIAFLAAAGVGVAAWLGTRRRGAGPIE